MSRGFVSVSVNRHNRLQLSFPVWLSKSLGQNRLFISLELPDTKENRKLAESKAAQINGDIIYERFDCFSKPEIKSKYQLGVSIPAISNAFSIELWLKFKDDKALTLKLKSLEALEYYTSILVKAKDVPSHLLKEKLLTLTTPQVARKILTYLSACYDWAAQNGLTRSNPYKHQAQSLPKPKWMSDPQPNPFTAEEKIAVITSFKDSETHSYYLPIIEFMLLTGCRPSEAIGLTWDAVDLGNLQITFKESIVLTKGKSVRSQKSKTNRIRKFPVNDDLHNLLSRIKFNKLGLEQLVFTAPKGGPINQNYFRKIWKKTVTFKKSTPYCCRDTFITEQIAKGTPIAILAKWVDSSTKMIEQYYLKAEATDLKPL